MSENELISKIKNAVVEGIEEEAIDFVNEAIKSGISVNLIINEAIMTGALEVGKLFEQREYFLSDMILSGEAINCIMEILKPLLEEDSRREFEGTVLIGTVEGDIHCIGKDIMITLLTSNGFNVIDLGVDIKPEVFLEKTKESNPDIVGLSCLLTVSISKMVETIVMLRQEAPNSKIIIGGGIMSEEVREMVNADAFTTDAMEGLNKIKGLMEEL